MHHWVYENTIHKKARIHRADCAYCNNGHGIHGGAKTASGEWFGPFADLDIALSVAHKRGWEDTRGCESCLEAIFQTPSSKRTTQIPVSKAGASSAICNWDIVEPRACSLRLRWTARGQVLSDGNRKLRFPSVPASPGLYRLRTRRKNGSQSVYIGESENLSRRFGNYRNPGPSQQTSLRINRFLIQLLSDNGEISVSVAEDAAITIADIHQIADFSDASIRRLFENFALLFEQADDLERLNR